jgi:hypothetical protein
MIKKVFILILLTMLLTGCGIVSSVLPNETDFKQVIEELSTPRLICLYMQDNFEYQLQFYGVKTPLELYLSKVGDCNDFSNFGVYIADHHNYDTYQIRIVFNDSDIAHWLGVYKEANGLTYSSNKLYSYLSFNSFKDIVKNYCNKKERVYVGYKVYDREMSLIEEVKI